MDLLFPRVIGITPQALCFGIGINGLVMVK